MRTPKRRSLLPLILNCLEDLLQENCNIEKKYLLKYHYRGSARVVVEGDSLKLNLLARDFFPEQRLVIEHITFKVVSLWSFRGKVNKN